MTKIARVNFSDSNSIKKQIITIISARKIFLILLLALLNINTMAQANYKSVKEAKGLNIGDIVKEFTAIDAENNLFTLSDALKDGPLVIIFYRGQWCPICNKHLSHLQDSLQLIYNKGARVIAISPEKPEYLKLTAEKTKASFILLYDEEYVIAKQFDVLFNPKSMEKTMYNTILKANLKEANTDDSQRLPIPATYIIDTDGRIVWRQFDPDYKNRSTVKDIIINIPHQK